MDEAGEILDPPVKVKKRKGYNTSRIFIKT